VWQNAEFLQVTAGGILYLLLAFKRLAMNVGLTLVRVFRSWWDRLFTFAMLKLVPLR